MTTARAPGLRDWLELLLLAIIWGTAFVFIDVGLNSVSPGGVAFIRLTLGAIILALYARSRGHHFPALTDPKWLWWMALGFFGNALPFYLIPWAQQDIPSALAGILLAVMPLSTVVLAHFFAGERMTGWKFAGFLVGLVGVIILIGPSALADLGGPKFLAQIAVLVAALAYAVNVIIARRAPGMPASLSAAGMLIGASLWAAPLGIWQEIASERTFDIWAWMSVVWLGIGPTAITSVIYLRLITNAGASFMATVNYLVPIVAVIAGLALGEAIGLGAILGLTVILAGIAIARRS